MLRYQAVMAGTELVEIDRDVNAALNILARARAGRARSHACGDPASTPAINAGASGIVEPGTIRGEPFGAIDAGRLRLWPQEDVTQGI